ncbi:protein of unknown function [Thauera humireducens]|nr:protein of unknown function [Thauera humireducens]
MGDNPAVFGLLLSWLQWHWA